MYPMYLLNKQCYWTVAGVHRPLISEAGAVEYEQKSPTIELFLCAGGEFVTWADVTLSQELEGGDLPIPSVVWETKDGIVLTVTLYESNGAVYIRYLLDDRSERQKDVRLFLAIRPFPVTPPWQHSQLSPIKSLEYEQRTNTVLLNGNTRIVSNITADGFGAVSFEESGNIVEHLRDGRLPDQVQVQNDLGLASGALQYDVALVPDDTWEVSLRVGAETDAAWTPLEVAAEYWRKRLQRIGEKVQDPYLKKIMMTVVAHILMNRDGPAFQPGPRFYARAWIRDAATMIRVLLLLGFKEEAREFIVWYAQYQGDDGNVPAIVDTNVHPNRPDWIKEHDCHGEFVYTIMEYFRATGDLEFVARMWPRVLNAVRYVETLRRKHLTDEFRETPYYGLLTESASHEGYIGKHAHSYWDNFWALRGLMDAVEMAEVLGDQAQTARLTDLRDSFKETLSASIRNVMRAMKDKGMEEYMPGSVENLDFDLPSTAIGVLLIPDFADEFRGTLEKMATTYLEKLEHRRRSKDWESYTPYEVRVVSVLRRLGRDAEAKKLLEYFLSERRPVPWNQWTEVNYPDLRHPGYVGDLPHTWVGAEVALAILGMLGLL
jgi:Amylo-alpha-1,6-glucosidase